MRRAATASVLALAAVVAVGCAGPRFAIPTARSPRVELPPPADRVGRYVETNGALAYGRDEVAPGIWEEVVRLPLPTRGRAYWRRRGKLTKAPQAGHPLAFRRAPEPELQVADRDAKSPADLRPAATTEIEDLQSLLHPLFKKSVTARAWLAERTDLESLRLDLQHRLARRAESAPPGSPSLLEALHAFYREESSESGENVPEGTEIVEPREESSTYLLGGIVHWGGKSPGLYRAKGIADAPPRSVGEDASSWWFLPVVSYEADHDEDSSELMLWPLLGLGFGKEEGQSYVRLFYFWKIGGKG